MKTLSDLKAEMIDLREKLDNARRRKKRKEADRILADICELQRVLDVAERKVLRRIGLTMPDDLTIEQITDLLLKKIEEDDDEED